MAWTDKQLRAHKKASAKLSVATSTMGIGALSLVGARAGAPKLVRAAQKAGHLKNVKPKQLKRFKAKSTGLQNGLITTSAGVGGVSGLNFAAVQNAEAKRRPRAPRPVAKRLTEVGMDGMDFGLGRVRQGEEITKAYDPEKKRLRRLDAYNAGTNAAAGGLAVGAGVAGHGLRHEIKRSVTTVNRKNGGKTVSISAAKLKPVGRKAAITAALGIGAVGAAAGADRIRSYGRGNGRSYKPLHGQY